MSQSTQAFFLSRKKSTASVLVPGGALEALNLNTDETQIRLILNRRKGFVKLALKHGVDLVPTFSFGENFIYDQTKTDTGNSIFGLDIFTVFFRETIYSLILYAHSAI